MSEKMFTISEAVRLIGVESHVLRYWEEELHINVGRTPQGHRNYSEDDIRKFQRIKELKDGGLQLKAIRGLLEEEATGRRGGYSFARFYESSDEEKVITEEESPVETISFSENEIYDVLVPQREENNLDRFSDLLKRVLEEVMQEENAKLEEAISERVREEIAAAFETAAVEKVRIRSGISWKEILKRIFAV